MRAEGRALKLRTALWLIVALQSETVSAAVSEQDFLSDVPIVLSASRLAQPLADAPGAVTVIDRDMIRASGFREIADLLRLVPGFYVGRYSGNEPVVARGLVDRYFGRVQVLVDGRSVYTPLFGQVPWSTLPLAMEDIERIEVIRGPNAASYGANAFLGVINIITRTAQEDRGTVLSATTGGQGVTDATLRHGGAIDKLHYRVTLGYQRDGGFPDRYDDKRIGLLTTRADYRLDTRDTMQFQAGLTFSKQGQGFPDQSLYPPHDQRITSHFQQLRWQRIYGPDDELSVQFHHAVTISHEATQTQQSMSGAVTVLPTYLALNTDAERYDLELQRTNHLADSARIVWGVNTRLDRVAAPLYLGSQANFYTHQSSVFANLEWRPTAAWVVNLGGMLEKYNLTGTDFSPRFALNYHLNPQHSLRVSVSKALRSPTLLEDAANYSLRLPISVGGVPSTVVVPRFISGGDLKPERIISRELAYLGEFPRLGLSLDMRVYKDEIDDIIDSTTQLNVPTNTQYYVFHNLHTATIEGIETQMRWQWKDLKMWFGHSLTRVESDYPSIVDATPRHIYSVLTAYALPQAWRVSVGVYHVSHMTPLNDGSPLNAYLRTDIKLAKELKWSGKPLEIALSGQNIFTPYAEYRDDNIFKRQYFMTLRYGW